MRAQRTAFTFDENPIALTITNESQNTVYKLRRNKTELIPSQKIVGNQLLLEIPQGDQLGNGLDAGYFELIKDNKVEQLIALNHNNAESRLDYYSPAELEEYLFQDKKMFRFLIKSMMMHLPKNFSSRTLEPVFGNTFYMPRFSFC